MLSIVIPAKNESAGLSKLLPEINSIVEGAEIIVVDDGSDDDTADVVKLHGAKLVQHPYSKGNGASIKSGARAASGDIIVFMDGDGQHRPSDIPRLLSMMEQGYDMVVGARTSDTQANVWRGWANRSYNKLASIMTGCKIDDLTSGFRAVKRTYFLRYLYLLPNGFSYPTTSTMAFFRSGLSVGYVPIEAKQREGSSHIRLLRDGTKFLVIIFKIGALFSPMRFFLPIAIALFMIGLTYYGYTYLSYGRFTNMSGLLFTTSVITFLMGLISEQISSLHYRSLEREPWVRKSPDKSSD